MTIIRVFPQRTSFTPCDDMVFIGDPPALLLPPHDEVHISCTFTWDMARCEELKYQWEAYTDKPVKLGGPAYGSPCDTFKPGQYVKQGIVFTSRGCFNNCDFCFVPKREGTLRELPICEGNIIQDNNFLQCSRAHKDKVFEMLKTQRAICFKGGLQNNLIGSHFIDNIRGLRIKELWLACDSANALSELVDAVSKLKAVGYTREHIHCYALISDDMDESEHRLQEIYRAGAMPFAQLYQPAGAERKQYSDEWRHFQTTWARPAATVTHMKEIERVVNE